MQLNDLDNAKSAIDKATVAVNNMINNNNESSSSSSSSGADISAALHEECSKAMTAIENEKQKINIAQKKFDTKQKKRYNNVFEKCQFYDDTDGSNES